MACVFRELLPEFAAGRLQGDRSTEICRHLAECPTCQETLDALSDDAHVRDFFRCHQRLSPSPDSAELMAELCERIHALIPISVDDCLEATTPAVCGELIQGGLGRFRLLERLGAGGFGVVYLAEDTQLNRHVALKVPRAGTLADRDARERFLRETRAAAALHHPQIVAVYDAGQHEGIYFLAAAYCPGDNLRQWQRKQERPTAPRTAATIVLALAEAAQHAHENGVLHRDIKPQNVLLDPTVRFRDLPFCPKLTDFSVAKLLEGDDEATVTNVLVGTPRYMAPEQASGRRDLIGPACDIYALGVVLYELLTGEPPIRGEDNADTLRRVLQDEPLPPRKRDRDVPRDLEAICLKCLEKSPEKRYPRAELLAQDLERFLHSQPTQARPLGAAEHLVRWIGRRPAMAGFAGIAVAGTLLLVGGLLLYNVRLNDFNTRLGRAISETQQLLYVSDMRLAARAWKDGDSRGMADFLRRHIPQAGKPDWRGLEWQFLWSRVVAAPETLETLPSEVYHLEISPDGVWVATAGKDAIVRIYRLSNGELAQSLPTGQHEVNSVCFSPDGQRLATAGDDGSVRIWSRKEARELLAIDAHPGHVMDVQFCREGDAVISSGKDSQIHVWDATTGLSRAVLEGRPRGTFSIDLSPDAKTLASASWGGTELWDLSERRPRQTLGSEHPEYIGCSIAFSPDGRAVALADMEGKITIFDSQDGKELAAGRHLDPVICIAFSADGRYLASTDGVGTISLWDTSGIDAASPPATPVELPRLRQWPGHQGRVYTAAFTGEGRLLTAGADGALRSWRLAELLKIHVAAADGKFGRARFLFDGRLLAAESDRLVEWSPAQDPGLKRGTEKPQNKPLLATDGAGKLLAMASPQDGVELWDLALGEQFQRRSVGPIPYAGDICLSPDGRRLAILGEQKPRAIEVFRMSDGAKVFTLPAPETALGRLCFSPDGSQLAFSSDQNVLRWSLETNLLEKSSAVSSHGGGIKDLAYSPDGALLASCGSDRLIKLWNPRSGNLVADLSSHLDAVQSLAFSPDGRTLFSADFGGVLKLWNVASREELFDIQLCEEAISCLTISQDGRWLAATATSGRILLLDLGHRAGQ